jgi:hypothetical protein
MLDKYKWISMYHGMELDPIARNDWRGNENGILFLSEWLIFKHFNGELTHEDIEDFISIVEGLRTFDKDGKQIEGLYDRGAGESLRFRQEGRQDELRTISHDNLTAIACFSKLIGLDYHKDIFWHGLKNMWRFDNAYPEKPRWGRIQHPRDMIFWSYLGAPWYLKWIAILFLPLVVLMQMQSCAKTYKVRPKFTELSDLRSKYGSELIKEEITDFGILKTYGNEDGSYGVRYIIHTDGKIFTVLRTLVSKSNIIMKIGGWICHHILKRKSTNDNGFEVFGEDYVPNMFGFYFKNPDHPVTDQAKKFGRKKWW